MYWLTAFSGGPPETVLGVDLSTGSVVFEQAPANHGGNLIDMAWVPQASRVAVDAATQKKRGLSGLEGCDDATALNLQSSWEYNWGTWPTAKDADGDDTPKGALQCGGKPRVAEFVPMFWGCGGNCTSGLWPTFRDDWKAVGVTHLLGWNEPDNDGQSDLTPEQAAIYWYQLDDLAQSFDPPLKLVGPGMTHWGDDGGSAWLDQFFGNLSDARAKRIVALGQHDYSGSAEGIIKKANAAYKKYNRPVWLTEFSVGSGADRTKNDAFMANILPLLDAADSVERYAWYSTRNAPAAWVNASSLLEVDGGGSGWSKKSGSACTEMAWLSQHGTADECKASTLGSAACGTPKVAVYQSGDVKNCYCANSSQCDEVKVSWQDSYVHHGPPPPPWEKTSGTACAPSEMLWVSQHKSLEMCQADALGTQGCVAAPTRTVIYESGDVKNCYCLNATAGCTKTASSWLDLFSEPPNPKLPATLTSTGKIYAK